MTWLITARRCTERPISKQGISDEGHSVVDVMKLQFAVIGNPAKIIIFCQCHDADFFR